MPTPTKKAPVKLGAKKTPKTKPKYAGLAMPKVKQIRLPGPNEFNEPSQEFTDYTTLIYGAKGIGKTTSTASFPDCLNISFEPKRRNVRLRMYPIEFKRATDIEDDDDDPWMELVEVCGLAIADPTIKTIAIDSVDIAYECCQEHICRKRGIENPGDRSDGGNAWNDLKATFTALFRTLIEEGISLVFISHSKERDQEFMDGVESVAMVGPSCSPACIKIMKQLCDFWFFYGYHEGQRCLTIRDPDRTVDVATGYGFHEADGSPINKIMIPDKPELFFETLNGKFKSKATAKTPAKAPATPVKKVARKLPPKK